MFQGKKGQEIHLSLESFKSTPPTFEKNPLKVKKRINKFKHRKLNLLIGKIRFQSRYSVKLEVSIIIMFATKRKSI